MGYQGWTRFGGLLHEQPLRSVLALGGPLLAAGLWYTFAVPDDPSRSGRAPVSVPGVVRLALELAFFALAAWALCHAGNPLLSMILAVEVIIHYVVSYDRIAWLLKQ